MFSYLDVKDKVAIMGKKMKYFTHKGKRSHLIYTLNITCAFTLKYISKKPFAPFLLASLRQDHDIDRQRLSELATGPQCGRY